MVSAATSRIGVIIQERYYSSAKRKWRIRAAVFTVHRIYIKTFRTSYLEDRPVRLKNSRLPLRSRSVRLISPGSRKPKDTMSFNAWRGEGFICACFFGLCLTPYV